MGMHLRIRGSRESVAEEDVLGGHPEEQRSIVPISSLDVSIMVSTFKKFICIIATREKCALGYSTTCSTLVSRDCVFG